MNLASYASSPSSSRGRIHKESQSSSRNDYQRDRDRIIHSASFRRLQYKTQVFVNHEGDMFRSRLTHSLEVAQISRSIARTLSCHEDLVEAIALAHDLGHTPFGHAGQDALNSCMKSFGGFEHNLQSLRVVDSLEKKYAQFNGLNLTFEVREGILKHCSAKNALELGPIGQRFLDKKQPSLEAQIVNIADEIAYSHHDLDDGFRSQILSMTDLKKIELFDQFRVEVEREFSQLTHERLLNEVIRRMMRTIIEDLCNETLKRISLHKPKTSEHLRELPPIVGFSNVMQNRLIEIKQFSREHLYQHPRIAKMTEDAKKKITWLFNYFMENNDEVLNSYEAGLDSKERAISDYIAGMTDRYAIQLVNSKH